MSKGEGKKFEEIQYVSEEGESDSDSADKKVKKLKEEQKAIKEESSKNLDMAMRALADYHNLQKRTEKEKEEAIEYAAAELICGLLPTIDSIEKASEHFENKPDSENTAEQDGIEQIYKQFKSFLEKEGVEEIKAVGEKFNHEFHEVVGVVEGEEPGIVVEEVQKGYCLHGKVIRPSKVKISK